MPKKKMPSQLYSGALADPLNIPRRGLLALEPNERHSELVEARMAKMPALFEYYGINQNFLLAWNYLAYRLACDHVPGFREAIPKGRKREHKFGVFGWDLWVRVELKRIQSQEIQTRNGNPSARMTAKSACESLARTGAYKGISSATLLRAYNRANRGARAVFTDAAAGAHGGDLKKCLLAFLGAEQEHQA